MRGNVAYFPVKKKQNRHIESNAGSAFSRSYLGIL